MTTQHQTQQPATLPDGWDGPPGHRWGDPITPSRPRRSGRVATVLKHLQRIGRAQ